MHFVMIGVVFHWQREGDLMASHLSLWEVIFCDEMYLSSCMLIVIILCKT